MCAAMKCLSNKNICFFNIFAIVIVIQYFCFMNQPQCANAKPVLNTYMNHRVLRPGFPIIHTFAVEITASSYLSFIFGNAR